MKTFICTFCGKSFEQSKVCGLPFCSRSCRALFNKPKIEEKPCIFCQKMFTPIKNSEDMKYCSKQCFLEHRKQTGYMEKYYEKNKEVKWQARAKRQDVRKRKNEIRKKRYAEDGEYKEKLLKKTKEFYNKHPEKKKAQRLYKYNLTIEDFNYMLQEQGGKCLICGYNDLSDKNMFPLVDHCHKTNIVRGLLCGLCNKGLGLFRDDISLLKNAIKYLQKYKISANVLHKSNDYDKQLQFNFAEI